MSGSETSMHEILICPGFAQRRQTGFSHLNHQAKQASLSFCRVIGILLPVLMQLLALRQHHSAVENPRRLCCTLACWADMGLDGAALRGGG